MLAEPYGFIASTIEPYRFILDTLRFQRLGNPKLRPEGSGQSSII